MLFPSKSHIFKDKPSVRGGRIQCASPEASEQQESLVSIAGVEKGECLGGTRWGPWKKSGASAERSAESDAYQVMRNSGPSSLRRSGPLRASPIARRFPNASNEHLSILDAVSFRQWREIEVATKCGEMIEGLQLAQLYYVRRKLYKTRRISRLWIIRFPYITVPLTCLITFYSEATIPNGVGKGILMVLLGVLLAIIVGPRVGGSRRVAKWCKLADQLENQRGR